MSPNKVAAATLTPFPPTTPFPAPVTPFPDTPAPPNEAETRLASDSEIRPGSAETPVGRAAPGGRGPLAPGDAFGTRYRILKELGAGGMGVVYHAWDEELGVALALKVIRPEVMADPYAGREVERRFKRELLLARQVTHHNVVRIHDLGEVNGIKYLTMPFIEGKNLASALAERGKLPIDEALRIAKQIAAGLQEAHVAGVVHRDLKPENVMLQAESAEAIIMDFGISRSMTGTGAGTAIGAVVGTLEYMSPEQGKGQQADQRADIYALGLILYDLLVGRRRLISTGGSAVAEMMARVQNAPPPARSLEPSIPEPVERVLTRSLEPDPDKRYQTIAELIADLDALGPDGLLKPLPKPGPSKVMFIGVAAAAILVALAAIWWGSSRGPVVPPAARDPVSVLVANFQNKTGDGVFDGSLEQPLAIGIEGAPFINSFSRSTAARIAGQVKPNATLDEGMARLVARREGIKVILAGAVEPDGSGYALSLRAIDPASDKEIASIRERASDKAGVLGAVAELANQIRDELGDTSIDSASDGKAETFTAASLEAVKAYSEAQDLTNRGRYEESIALYKRAIEQDPAFGRAYSGWAVAAHYLGRPAESADLFKKALAQIDRMTEREKYRTLGGYYLSVARNYHQAVDNYAALVERYPADLTGQNNLAISYFSLLNFAKAREHGGRALSIYPNNVIVRANYALYAMYAGDFAAAEREAGNVIKLDPAFHKAYLVQAVAAFVKGDTAAARDAYARMEKTGQLGASTANLGLADLAMAEGKYDEAITILTPGLNDDVKSGNQASVAAKQLAIAEAHAAMGRMSPAAAAAREALKIGKSPEIAVPAGTVLAKAGQEPEVRALIGALEADLQPQIRAYAKVLEGAVALERRRFTEAVDAFRATTPLADLWLARFGLAVAYIEAGAAPEGLSGLDACQKRRGEATSAFLDDLPTLRYLAPLPYWVGRAREGMHNAKEAQESYKQFLAPRANATDGLSRDARRRLGQ